MTSFVRSAGIKSKFQNQGEAVIRQLSEAELNHYRWPFRNSGEDRRPMLSWPRSLPIDGKPADVTEVVRQNQNWLAHTDVPRLFINGEPGTLVRSWPIFLAIYERPPSLSSSLSVEC